MQAHWVYHSVYSAETLGQKAEESEAAWSSLVLSYQNVAAWREAAVAASAAGVPVDHVDLAAAQSMVEHLLEGLVEVETVGDLVGFLTGADMPSRNSLELEPIAACTVYMAEEQLSLQRVQEAEGSDVAAGDAVGGAVASEPSAERHSHSLQKEQLDRKEVLAQWEGPAAQHATAD